MSKAGVFAFGLSVLCASSMAVGQGVPITDEEKLAQELAATEQKEKSLAEQKIKASKQDELLALDDELLAELDALIAATGPVPVSGAEVVDKLEGGSGDESASVAEVYPQPDNNPAASKVFGDAAPSVEEVIIEGAKATYGHPGVAKAGLSLPQWRALLQAVIWQESRFNPFIGSSAGAYGLTQLMPATADEVGVGADYRTNPYSQVVGGATYLARMLDRQNGNIVEALACYNAGPGNVDKYGGVPPFKETQHYVVVIPQKYNEYLGLIGGVDALGTIDPVLASGAIYAIAADGAGQYAASSAEIGMIAQRLKDIVLRMKANSDPETAWTLNSYARAEMARVMVLQTRMFAAQGKMVGAGAMQDAAAQASERAYMKFSND